MWAHAHLPTEDGDMQLLGDIIKKIIAEQDGNLFSSPRAD
jgi:hypothetical protein